MLWLSTSSKQDTRFNGMSAEYLNKRSAGGRERPKKQYSSKPPATPST